MTSKIDRAESLAETKARLHAAWVEASRPVMALVMACGNEKAHEALCRRQYAQGLRFEWSPDDWLAMCGGELSPQPGDIELIAAFEASIPSDILERLKEAAEAAKAAGVDDRYVAISDSRVAGTGAGAAQLGKIEKDALRLFDAAWQNIAGAVSPLAPSTADAAIVIEAAFTCGQSLLRAWAHCIRLGVLEHDDELPAALEETAAQLDAAGVPDLAGRKWDAASFARDEHGAHVYDTDSLWTWLERLAAVRRHCEEYGVGYEPLWPLSKAPWRG